MGKTGQGPGEEEGVEGTTWIQLVLVCSSFLGLGPGSHWIPFSF